ncbi:MAG: hypothetical protein RBR19_12390 [Sedimentisphaerales bacterium]|jgi:hypothetical protein|nr:hypothetical protein [Sedimentisphaerales bacterium]NLT77677.1 hypothetical protein [Planctomycetota bacterium]
MAKCLAIRHGQDDSRDHQSAYDHSAPSAQAVSGVRRRIRIGRWLIGLSAGAALVYLSSRYWLLGVVTISIAVGLSILACFMHDYSPQDMPQGPDSH